MPDRFDELKPYRSLLLASVAAGSQVGPVVNNVLDDVRDVIDDGPTLQFGSRINDSAQGGIRTGFLHYVEERSPGWSVEDVTDTLNQLVVVCRLRRLVAQYASDTRLRATLARRFGNATFPGLAALEPIARERLNAAFVQGPTRTLWLSGTHRRTTVKADSKILAGLNLRDSLDPLDDQSYYFSAARSVPVGIDLPVGVSPRKSAVWAGASRSWEEFVTGVAALLDHLDTTTEPVAHPLPVVATQTADVDNVTGAFDVSLQPPELTADPTISAEERERVELWAYRSVFEVADAGPPIQTRVLLDDTLLGTAVIDVDMSDPNRVTCDVTGVPTSPELADIHAEAVQHCRSPRWVKIRYDSGHTLSDGVVFEQRHRDVPFQGFRFVDVTGFDLRKEKPDPITAVGTGQDSLFDWTHRFWPNLDGTQQLPGGFLVSDDGSMEIADFIHLDQTGDVPVISLIHVKAAGSRSPNRGISVSSYEVVTGQAVKNLRFMDQLILSDGLADGLGSAISGVAFFERGPSTRQEMIDALREIGSNYRRRVVVVQPHVTRDRHDEARANPGTSNAARLRQLDTLLLGAEANAHALGAEFLVVTSA